MPEEDFKCSVVIRLPFPTHRLASIALHALAVDEELSPLVRRSFSLDAQRDKKPPVASHSMKSEANDSWTTAQPQASSVDGITGLGTQPKSDDERSQHNVLVTEYRATTDRMLRVSVNGFFESVGVIIASMRELDEDVVELDWLGEGDPNIDNLARVQGLQEVGVI
ncbi:MAG: hypothetical protein Q9162_001520 [Coniocarpon cinnabarinum]